jgi:RNA polymerase sigma-70 factor (ECF subfamily)
LALLRVTDQELVERVLQGKAEAFNHLVSRWEKKLYNYACRLTGDREEAMDICQDAFTRAYEQLSQLKDPGKFSFWLFKIARNFCFSRYRSGKTQVPLQREKEGEDAIDLENLLSQDHGLRLDSGRTFELQEMQLMVRGALDFLPFEQRETIVLKIYEGLKFSEIAELAECPVSTVKSRLYLGMAQLKKILTEKGQG